MSGSDASELARDSQWQRLDPRMLLVHPINEAIRFLPVLIGIFVAGNAAGDGFWELAGIGIPVITGMLRYLTTSFRVSDGRVELRRGLLSRHVLSTPVARVRTVDLTASPIHRVLGLTKVRVGTGTASTSGEDRLDLDSLPTARAQLLREELLRAAAPDAGAAADGVDPPQPILTLDPRWVRFAPFTLSGVVIASGAAAVLGQALSLAGGIRIDVEGAAEALRRTPLAVELTVAGFSVAVVASVFAVLGYLVNNWGFSLTRAASSFHVRRGMFTTRETSIDIARVHGVEVGEPLGLRIALGSKLAAVVTGLDRRTRASSTLVPPAPRRVVREVAAHVLDDRTPLAAPLVDHGPAARRRRYIRALGPALLVLAVAALAVPLWDWPAWPTAVAAVLVVSCAVLAADRVRALGHALVEGSPRWLVVRSGSLARRRDVLDCRGIIGWNLRDSWFQRRAGLVTLVATTSGGRQAYIALDVPADRGVAVARSAAPELVEQFLL